jgi:rubrerythrin
MARGITRRHFVTRVVPGALVLAASPRLARAANATTAQNLLAAYGGECNAHAKYLAFAAKADGEGFGATGSLFRAVAKAEEVHAGNLAEVIKEGGGTPKAEIKAADVKATQDNLKAAIAGETYEKDTMYPAFIKQAKQEANADALKAFNYAKAAEVEHARLYAAALADLPKGKSAKTEYYVCPVCGMTTKGKPGYGECPVCYTKIGDFHRIA